MIIQCEQCATKFRLDDAKVTEAGVKVRCSKCKYVFIVRKDAPEEDHEVDSILMGLDAQRTSEENSVASSGQSPLPEQESSIDDQAVTGQGEEPSDTDVAGFAGTPLPDVPSQGEPVPKTGDIFSNETSFADVFEDVAPQQRPTDDFRFEEFAFGTDFEKDLAGEVPEEASSSPGEGFDYAAFSLDGTTTPPQSQERREELAETSFEMEDSASIADEIVASFDDAPVAATAPTEEERIIDEALGKSFELHDEEKENPAAFGDVNAGTDLEPETVIDFGDLGVSDGETFDLPAESGEDVLPLVDDQPADVVAVSPAVAAITEQRSEPSPIPVSFAGNSYDSDSSEPLPLTSRKKGSSIFPIVLTSISILGLVGLAGAGFFMFKEGPEGLNKIGLGSVASLVGIESNTEGGIGLEKVEGMFLKNNEAGEILVLRGVAVNGFKKSRASIRVRVNLLNAKGEVITQKVAYCGNPLTKEQLATLPMGKIEAAMNNQFGDSLANLEVHPGKKIPFVIVFSNVSKEVKDFSAEVIDSTAAGQ